MSLVSSLVWFYDDHYRQHASHVVEPSHSAELFKRFIMLVNEHCRGEHQLSFYADRLCLTQRHLGVVVKQVSGVTAKEWIDRALIAEAKVMLQHTDKTVVQIADALNRGIHTDYVQILMVAVKEMFGIMCLIGTFTLFLMLLYDVQPVRSTMRRMLPLKKLGRLITRQVCQPT